MNTKRFLGMDRITALAAVIFMLMFANPMYAQTSSAVGGGNGALSITNLQVLPQPVVAGENVTVQFQLYNSYTQTLNNVNLYLQAENPIINVTPSHSFITDTIGQGIFGGLGYDVFDYTLHIPNYLPSGVYTIDVIANYQTSQADGFGTTQEEPAQSVMPITIYVHGLANVNFNIVPEGSISPGVPFAATLEAVNSGGGAARNLTVKLLNGSIIAVGSSTINFGNVGQTPSTSQVMLEENQNISRGTNYLNLNEHYSTDYGMDYSSNIPVPIDVILNKPDIIVSAVSATPQTLTPGSNQTLELQVQNTGIGTAKNVQISFIKNSFIAPEGSTSSLFFGTLAPGQSMSASLLVQAYENMTSSGNENLSADVSYNYSNGMNRTLSVEYIPLHVSGSAVFNVTAVYSKAAPGATYVPLKFTVKNVGNEPANGAYLTLESIYPITVTDSNVYVNSIAPGSSENVTFYISVDKQGSAGDYPATIYEQWRQPNGALTQEYSSSNNYYVPIGSAESNGSSSAYVYITLVIVVLAIVVIANRAMTMRKKSTKVKKDGQKKSIA